ncbi:MAG: YjjG family noncanonical pyrimidine nucleotidase [Treponema sp.]|jgi:YjjG family noncanonical pyrimidine nucleotidase|nr:YjjG family noncanonical pyrimidine nucleotidase [Treponema sp.]
MKNYNVFLFDADGTLFDFDRAEENALETVFKTCGLNYSRTVLERYREINKGVWKSYETGEISKEELQPLRFNRLFSETGVEYNACDFNAKYLYELGKGSFLIDGALEICREICSLNKQIYIVTNGILAVQKARIEYSAISGYIAGYFVSEFVGFQKPQKEYFDYVFSGIQTAGKEKILIIGDSLSADIAGGNNAGIDSCWLNLSGAVNDTGIAPVYEISSLHELRKFFTNEYKG